MFSDSLTHSLFRLTRIPLGLLVPLSLMLNSHANATTWYVDDGSNGNGTSWIQAWNSPTAISWSSIKPGDTIYIGAGSYGALTIGKSGTAAARIAVRAAQDTQIGVASFSSINFAQLDYVTIDGGYNGNRNFATTGGVSAGAGVATLSPALRYVTITRSSGGDNSDANSTAVDFRWVANGEFAYNLIDIRGSLYGVALNMVAPQHTKAYGQGSVHHNTIFLPGRVNNGSGPDGIQAASGYDIYNNTIQSFATGTGNISQHQDQIQAYGDNYLRVYGNTFIDSGDSQFDMDSGASSAGHLFFYNNVLSRTVNNMGTVGARFYSSNGTLTSITDLHINNNTFVDCARTSSSFGAALRVQDSSNATYSDAEFKNNIIYNCGDGWPAALIEGKASGWSSSNNLINKGSEGNTNISGLTNTNGSTGIPIFKNYTPYSLSNDYHLATGDTVAKDKGVSLSAFNTDKDGAQRPQGSAWDIGAYEVDASGTEIPLVEPKNLRVVQ